MDFFRGILSALVFAAFLVLLFVAGFLMGKAYGQEPIPAQWEQALAWHSSTATDFIRSSQSI